MTEARTFYPLRYTRTAHYSYADGRVACFPRAHTGVIQSVTGVPADGRVGEYRGGLKLVLFIAAPGWLRSTEGQRYQIVLHEAYHWFQSLGYPWSRDPEWLIEGSAEWSAFNAAVRLGHLPDLDAIRTEQRARLPVDARPLREYEARQPNESYALFFTAVDALVRDHGGRTALDRFWSYRPDLDWHLRFKAVFGVYVRTFYAEFAARA